MIETIRVTRNMTIDVTRFSKNPFAGLKIPVVMNRDSKTAPMRI